MTGDERGRVTWNRLGVKSARVVELVGGAGERMAARLRPPPEPTDGSREPGPRPLPPLAPARPTQIRLPDGRSVRVVLSPAAGQRDDLVALRRVSAANDRAAFRAIARLEASQRQLQQRVAELERERDLGLASLLDGLAGLRRRIDRVQSAQTTALTREKESIRKLVSRQRRVFRSTQRAQAVAAQVQKATAAATTLQVAAFGENGNLLAANNLLLAGNQLLWSLIEPFLRGLGLAWLAPFGSLALGQATIGSRQTARVVSGSVTFEPGTRQIQVSLLDRVAASRREALRRRTDLRVEILDGPFETTPVLAATASDLIFARGRVRDGVLIITLGAILDDPVRVRFQVDVGPADA